MNQALVDKIVEAVLYEGYNLYPYRPSLKSRQRWTFGGVYPRGYSEAQAGVEAWNLQTQCLVQGGPGTRLQGQLRFLQLQQRRVGRLTPPVRELADGHEPPCEFVESLQIGAIRCQAWQEALEREVAVGPSTLQALVQQPQRVAFAYPQQQTREPLRAADGMIAGLIRRDQAGLEGYWEVGAEPLGDDLYRVTARIQNDTSWESAEAGDRDAALLRAFCSAHVILAVHAGAFVSLMDPPTRWRAAATACRNIGLWPVLVGTPGEQDAVLASPIILYDYPQLAPESPGNLFDGTEIDELLTLRIMTLTDEEKQAAAAVDQRTRRLLQRTESLARSQLAGLHGAVRSLRLVADDAPTGSQFPTQDPFSAGSKLQSWRVGDVELAPGDHVRLRPHGGADVFDLALKGKVATIESIEQDFEGRVYLAVTVDEDPGQDFGRQRQPGHRFFFKPEEVLKERASMITPRILIAGVGNIFLGDDAFGGEVAQRLLRRSLPDAVRVVDFGIRGLDLAYAILDGYDAVIVVDAVSQGQAPGTLYVIEPEIGDGDDADPGSHLIGSHGLTPTKVLRLVRDLGGQVQRLLLVGCEPSLSESDEMGMEMSAAVKASVDAAADLVESLAGRLLNDEPLTLDRAARRDAVEIGG